MTTKSPGVGAGVLSAVPGGAATSARVWFPAVSVQGSVSFTVLASNATPGSTGAAFSAVTGLPVSASCLCWRKYST